MPQAYLATDPHTGEVLFYQGTDFSYPVENAGLLVGSVRRGLRVRVLAFPR